MASLIDLSHMKQVASKRLEGANDISHHLNVRGEILELYEELNYEITRITNNIREVQNKICKHLSVSKSRDKHVLPFDNYTCDTCGKFLKKADDPDK